MKFNKIKKILYGKDNEANASRSNYVGYTYVGWKNFSVLQLFYNTEKNNLN